MSLSRKHRKQIKEFSKIAETLRSDIDKVMKEINGNEKPTYYEDCENERLCNAYNWLTEVTDELRYALTFQSAKNRIDQLRKD